MTNRYLFFIGLISIAIIGISCNNCKECKLTDVLIKDSYANRYYLWDDGTVRSLPQDDVNASSARRFGVICSNDLEDCIDGEYQKFCGTDLDNVQQNPYLVSGHSVGDTLYTAEYTYECK